MSVDEILSEQQLREYRDTGLAFVPGLLSPGEVAPVMERVRRLCAGERRREVILEKDGKTVRSLMNAHRFDDLIDRFVRHPKLIGAARQIVASDVYIFQSIINLKWAFTGDVWPWHQDYPTYMEDDGVPTPRMVNVLVFLEEVTEFNGPLMFIPGSHAGGAACHLARYREDQLSRALDLHRPRRDGGEEPRHRRAQGTGGLGRVRAHQHPARLGAEHVALGPRHDVAHAQLGREPPHRLAPTRLGRAQRLHAGGAGRKRLTPAAPAP